MANRDDKLIVITDARTHPIREKDIKRVKKIGGILKGTIDCKTEEEVIRIASEADAIINASAPLTANVIKRLHRCKVISRYGIGYDNIDVDAATKSGIVVTNVPGYCIEEVSLHALMLILACSRKLKLSTYLAKNGKWWPFDQLKPIGTIYNQVLGMVGFGNIARSLARKAKALKMNVIVYDPYVKGGKIHAENVEKVTFEKLLTKSDYLSLLCPLTKETYHLVGKKELKKMKPTAILINVARGAIVDEKALIHAIRKGWIQGAGLDVLEDSPPSLDNPLLTMENVIVTPHVASYSDASFDYLHTTALDEAILVLQGKRPRNVVNPHVYKKGRYS